MTNVKTLEDGLRIEDELHLSFQALLTRIDKDLRTNRQAVIIYQSGNFFLKHLQTGLSLAKLVQIGKHFEMTQVIGKYNGDIAFSQFQGWEQDNGKLSDIKYNLNNHARMFMEASPIASLRHSDVLNKHCLFPDSEMS